MEEPRIAVPDELEEGSVAPRYILRLYVTGKTPNSVLRASPGLKEICEEYLHGHYQLQVIDIYQQPALAEGDHILVAPTLVRKLPAPLRRLIGDFPTGIGSWSGLELQPVPGG